MVAMMSQCNKTAQPASLPFVVIHNINYKRSQDVRKHSCIHHHTRAAHVSIELGTGENIVETLSWSWLSVAST